MSGAGLFYTQSALQKSQPNVLDFTFNITAATTSVLYPPAASAVLSTYTALTQPTIDAFLGTVNEFTAAQFDATAMGADAFGGIINMNGQAAQVVRMNASCTSGTGGATAVSRVVYGPTGLTASTLETAVGIGAFGNLAFKIDFGNTPDFDALTAGIIVVRIYWVAK